MIRIKDIADRAGVSPTTVSNVIHGKTGRVSKATVEKINRILKEMEYVPSISARMLANNICKKGPTYHMRLAFTNFSIKSPTGKKSGRFFLALFLGIFLFLTHPMLCQAGFASSTPFTGASWELVGEYPILGSTARCSPSVRRKIISSASKILMI